MGPQLHETRPLLLPWKLLLYIYNIKVLKVEILLFLICMSRIFYLQLTEQYYYHSYGSGILRNTSFVFPDGPFCVTSDLINRYTGNNNSYKLDETKSNHLAIYTMTAYTVPSVIMTILMGSLMDRYGRKIGLIIPAIGTALQTILSIYIIIFNLNPYYFILSNFIGGCFGSFTCTLAAAFSYIADISSPRWRSLRIGIVEAGLAFGGAMGQFFIGFWLHRINCDYMPPLYFVSAISVFILVYLIFFVPESLSDSERKARNVDNPGKLKTYIEGFKLYSGRLSIRSTIRLYVPTIAMNVMAINIFGDVFVSTFVLKALPFDFNPLQIGIYQSVRSTSQGLANLLVMSALVLLKVGDVWIILLSLVVHITGNVLIGFSRYPWELYSIVTLKGIEGLVWSGGRGMISKLISPDRQGAVFSIVASLESLASLLASVIWPIIFPITLQHNLSAGMTYIFMAALAFMLVPPVLSLFFLKKEDFSVKMMSDNSSRPINSNIAAKDDEHKPLLWNTNDNHKRNS